MAGLERLEALLPANIVDRVQLSKVFNTSSNAGRILTAAAAGTLFMSVLALLPLPKPTAKQVPEPVPSLPRRLGRYFVPFLPLMHGVMTVAAWTQYYFKLLATPGSLGRTGTFPMRLFYTEVPAGLVVCCY